MNNVNHKKRLHVSNNVRPELLLRKVEVILILHNILI